MKEQNKKKILLRLFLSTLYLSAFTFGGGYVIVTLMKKKFVDEYHWIEENEMLDLVAIAQSSPGAIAVNGAIVVGYKLAGIAGTVTAIFGTVLPPFAIITVISVFYQAFQSNWLISQLLEGMQAGVGAVIASVTLDMGTPVIKEKDTLSIAIMAGAFIAACFFEVNVIYIIITCGLIGAVLRMHGDRGPHNIPPLDDRDFGGGYLYTGQSNELWSYGEENYRIMKKYYDIRISMHDYIKQLYDEASENGSPLIRTMFYEFPDDKKCWELQDQYMFGSEYLVANSSSFTCTRQTAILEQ